MSWKRSDNYGQWLSVRCQRSAVWTSAYHCAHIQYKYRWHCRCLFVISHHETKHHHCASLCGRNHGNRGSSSVASSDCIAVAGYDWRQADESHGGNVSVDNCSCCHYKYLFYVHSACIHINLAAGAMLRLSDCLLSRCRDATSSSRGPEDIGTIFSVTAFEEKNSIIHARFPRIKSDSVTFTSPLEFYKG
ncbi:uncharacterized protein YALI1_C16420g [Yarrowia lipolytica]|uniref:Uncharacterized protein n=1 Tax=Yarrowia lipolytica TaxID=4952 RepID=A0A1D8NAQ9_YARLL|nr:hypothetical protein YALI1_C16420g [Yarrowia lipolytica]